MRPLFAIAPLAAVLVLVGPTPHEANVAIAKIRDRLLSPSTAKQQVEDKQPPASLKR